MRCPLSPLPCLWLYYLPNLAGDTMKSNMQMVIIWSAALLTPVASAAESGLKLLSFTTLLGEIITFAILVWVMMKFVWPPLMKAIDSRQKEIADGLAAADQGRQDLAAAEVRKNELMNDARTKASTYIAEGEKRRSEIVDAARHEAQNETARILEQGRRDLELERIAMSRELETKLGELVIAGTSQVLAREVDATAHADIVASLKQSLRS